VFLKHEKTSCLSTEETFANCEFLFQSTMLLYGTKIKMGAGGIAFISHFKLHKKCLLSKFTQ
jgi:hypothetical protein